MKWNELMSLRISELILKQLVSDDRIKLKQNEEDVRKRMEQTIQENFKQERELIQEVYQMMEDLESQGHAFERQKMFPLLKAQLAKKKGVVL